MKYLQRILSVMEKKSHVPFVSYTKVCKNFSLCLYLTTTILIKFPEKILGELRLIFEKIVLTY